MMRRLKIRRGWVDCILIVNGWNMYPIYSGRIPRSGYGRSHEDRGSEMEILCVELGCDGVAGGHVGKAECQV